jgi:protein phosphatase
MNLIIRRRDDMMKVSYLTNRGKGRKINEDSLLVNDLIVYGTSMSIPDFVTVESDNTLFVVADGMGGHAKGELASRIVIEVLRDNHVPMQSEDDVPKLLRLAKEALNDQVRRSNEYFGLGTTVAGILIREEKAIIFNCGDSRVYRYKNKALEKLTHDHSIVQDYVDYGIITEEEMRFHNLKNILTASIMGDLRNDIPKVFTAEITIENAQMYLLCTDGVWGAEGMDDLLKSFMEKDVLKTANALYAKIMEGEAADNFSFIVLEAG